MRSKDVASPQELMIRPLVFSSSVHKVPDFQRFQNGDGWSVPKNGDILSQNGHGQNVPGTHHPGDAGTHSSGRHSLGTQRQGTGMWWQYTHTVQSSTVFFG
jgi:hypothetical protein